jgi:hypothetical protein
LGSLEGSNTHLGQSKAPSSGLRVRPLKAQLPQGLTSRDLTEKQLHAFSKESLLKPAMQPSSLSMAEETKEPSQGKRQSSYLDTPHSQISQSTFSSDTKDEQLKSLASQRQLSTSQLRFDRPQSAAT